MHHKTPYYFCLLRFVTNEGWKLQLQLQPSPPRDYSRRRRSPSSRGRYGGRGRDLPTSLLIRNLRHDCRPEDLRGPCGQFGRLKDIYLPRDYYTGKKPSEMKARERGRHIGTPHFVILDHHVLEVTPAVQTIIPLLLGKDVTQEIGDIEGDLTRGRPMAQGVQARALVAGAEVCTIYSR